MVTKEQAGELLEATVLIARAIVDTVADIHPEPAIEGVMYASYISCGGGIHSFKKIMAKLVEVEILVYIGNHQFVLSDQLLVSRKLAPHKVKYTPQEYSYGL